MVQALRSDSLGKEALQCLAAVYWWRRGGQKSSRSARLNRKREGSEVEVELADWAMAAPASLSLLNGHGSMGGV